jgi:cytochrome b
LGSLSVIALLLVLAAQAGTGLFIETDDFFESGPLYGYVSEATINSLTWWHHFLSKVLLALVVLHLVAIVFYRLWKREDLIKPMITGWKWVRRKSID